MTLPPTLLVHPTAPTCSITLFSILHCIRQLRTSKLMPGNPTTLSQRICTSRYRFKPLRLILHHVEGPRVCHDAKNSRYRKIFLKIFEAFDHWKKNPTPHSCLLQTISNQIFLNLQNTRNIKYFNFLIFQIISRTAMLLFSLLSHFSAKLYILSLLNTCR